MNADARKKVLDAIGESLPKHFKINEQKVYSPKTIYNLLSQGKGPVVVDIRGQKFLERDSFIEWLDDGSRTMRKRGRKRAAA